MESLNLIKIPAYFYIDHDQRALPTPEAIKVSGASNYGFRYVWISKDDPALSELIDDAEFYADRNGPSTSMDGRPCKIKNSAKALLKSLHKQGAYLP